MARVLFVQNNGINESLALTEVAAVLNRAGHRYRLFLEDEERDLTGEIAAFNPNVAILPCHVAGHQEALRFAEQIKGIHPNCVVVLAGTHATFDPELALRPEVDGVCVGEADEALLELCGRIDADEDWRDSPNLAVEQDGAL